MQRVTIDSVENSVQPAAVMRPLTGPLGATDVAVNYYELAPGDSFAFAYHSHEVQEEIFYVQAGTATFETADGPVDVGPGEAVRFGPGEFQRGRNRGEDRVVALAIGAPLAYGEQVKLRECPACGERTEQRIDSVGEETRVTVCEDCDTETARWTRGPDGENRQVEPDPD
ncbi:MAG: cupin domain-containing protein [Halobacteriaceae archaeon]